MALIDDLTDLIGSQNTIEMVRGWGGRQISIPATIPDHHPITMKIGREAASILAFHYGGSQIYLPVERSALIEQRNSQIVARINSGASPREVGDEYGLTPRHVRFIYARTPPTG